MLKSDHEGAVVSGSGGPVKVDVDFLSLVGKAPRELSLPPSSDTTILASRLTVVGAATNSCIRAWHSSIVNPDSQVSLGDRLISGCALNAFCDLMTSFVANVSQGLKPQASVAGWLTGKAVDIYVGCVAMKYGEVLGQIGVDLSRQKKTELKSCLENWPAIDASQTQILGVASKLIPEGQTTLGLVRIAINSLRLQAFVAGSAAGERGVLGDVAVGRLGVERGRPADVEIDNQYCSGAHAKVCFDLKQRSMTIKDTSTNGTFVNGRNICGAIQSIECGDSIELGNFGVAGGLPVAVARVPSLLSYDDLVARAVSDKQAVEKAIYRQLEVYRDNCMQGNVVFEGGVFDSGRAPGLIAMLSDTGRLQIRGRSWEYCPPGETQPRSLSQVLAFDIPATDPKVGKYSIRLPRIP